MKDKLYMVLAFIGIIILATVYWFNRDTTNSEVVFDIIDSYYVPIDQAISNDTAANELFDEMIGNRRVQCPITEPTMTSRPIYFGTFTSYEKSKYGVQTYFIDDEATTLFNNYINSTDIEGLPTEIKTSFNKNESVTFEDINATADVIEIVAPFKFTFLNNNTDIGNSIVIVNSKGNCKITFDNVTNWFCAGIYGTTMESGSGTYSNGTSWEQHQGNHLTIIGSSRNSKVGGGVAGNVIGYGNEETTITIHIKDDSGNWVNASLMQMLTDTE